jgi:heme/copper-type cytochrome/quinol oxidase subunit 2
MPRMRFLPSWRNLLVAVPFVLLGLAVMVAPIPTLQKPITRHITLNATQFEYAPGRIEVNQGDRLSIDLTASDVVHGFYVDGYGIDQRVEPGLTKQIAFVADRSGKFHYRCSVSCGPLHPFMIGELVVGPNLPFERAIGLLLVALAGILAHLWQSQSIFGGEANGST